MEKQMKAERERREAILRAEGEKQLRHPDRRGREAESAVLRADAKKQEQILEAAGPRRGHPDRAARDRRGHPAHQ